MKAAGLKAIDTVMESTAVLVKSRGTKNELVELIASRIRGVISMFFFLLITQKKTVHRVLTYALQPLNDTFSASTTSLARSWLPRLGSLPARERRL